MKPTLRKLLFRYMIGVIAVVAVIRVAVWLGYQAFEASKGHVVLHEQLNELLLLLLIEVIAMMVLVFMLWRLARVLLSPLRSIANAANLISEGHLTKRIRTDHLPEGELHEIATALNSSFDRYQDSINRITRFSSAASHQLRTPLTAIQATAELALSKVQSPEEHEKALESILEEIGRLTRMTEQLLTLSRMQAEHLRADFTTVDLNAIVRQVIELFQPLVEAKDISLKEDFAAACLVQGEPTLLTEVVTNLLDNAIKVSPTGGQLIVQTACDEDRCALSIGDSGPGIEEQYRAQLFEPFGRHPSASYKGSGLGLSIVSEAVKLHDGHIEVSSNEFNGATFQVFLSPDTHAASVASPSSP